MNELELEPGSELSDRLLAATNLIARSGALELELGYLHDTADYRDADWWATARHKGRRTMTEHHLGPVEAAEALARQLVDGGRCTYCAGTITLDTAGTAPTAARCVWRRVGTSYLPGCWPGKK